MRFQTYINEIYMRFLDFIFNKIYLILQIEKVDFTTSKE